MFHFLVAWLAVGIAIPVCLALITNMVLVIIAHQYSRLGIELNELIGAELRIWLAPQVTLRPKEEKLIIDKLRESARSITPIPTELVDDESRLQAAATSWFLDEDSREAARLAIRTDSEEFRAAALVRTRARMEKLVSPVSIARISSLLVTCEQIRLVLYALRRSGLRTAKLLIRRSGEDVTDWTVWGLIISIVIWAIVKQLKDRDEFDIYIANGLAIGALVGLALAAFKLFDQAIRAANPTVSRKTTYLCAGSILAMANIMLLLLQFGLPWLPTP